MAFRSETKAGACVMLWIWLACPAWAQAAGTYEVRHRHLHRGGEGVLRIDEAGISFEERGKRVKHSRQWKYDDIQQLMLGREALRIVTYEDQRWELGRDREYVFDRLPAALARDWYPVFASRLDQRFIAALADEQVKPEWQVPAKLLHGLAGSEGMLLMGAGRVVYKCSLSDESRTWRISDLENDSSSDSFDLTITTRERDFRFQLKQPLAESQFDRLWRRVNQANGLQILGPDHSTGEQK